MCKIMKTCMEYGSVTWNYRRRKYRFVEYKMDKDESSSYNDALILNEDTYHMGFNETDRSYSFRNILSSIEEVASEDHWSPSEYEQVSGDTWAEIDHLREDSPTELKLGSCANALELDVASSSGFVDDFAPDADAVFKNVALQQLNCDVGASCRGNLPVSNFKALL